MPYPRQPLTADATAVTARHRAVTAVVADLLVTAASGKTLRVAVYGMCPDQRAFAEQLTRDLRARGRACRCLTPGSTPVTPRAQQPAGGCDHDQTVAVITGGAPGLDDSDLCRINIRLHTPAVVTAAVARGSVEAGRHDVAAAGDEDADIVVDYLNPDGPTIRHLGPVLAA